MSGPVPVPTTPAGADLHELLVELIDAHHHRPSIRHYRHYHDWKTAREVADQRRATAWANAITATGHQPQPPGQTALFEVPA